MFFAIILLVVFVLLVATAAIMLVIFVLFIIMLVVLIMFFLLVMLVFPMMMLMMVFFLPFHFHTPFLNKHFYIVSLLRIWKMVWTNSPHSQDVFLLASIKGPWDFKKTAKVKQLEPFVRKN
ncbi:hypothetical protein CHI06_15860 [Bacillus sp. 7884-1]|nr:hypothetical protein CHI06_15860 [Bacillus sp. 7884-1]